MNRVEITKKTLQDPYYPNLSTAIPIQDERRSGDYYESQLEPRCSHQSLLPHPLRIVVLGIIALVSKEPSKIPPKHHPHQPRHEIRNDPWPRQSQRHFGRVQKHEHLDQIRRHLGLLAIVQVAINVPKEPLA